MNVERQQEYWSLCKAVMKAGKKDREVWLNAVMEEMEDSLKCHRERDFFRKLRDLNASRVKPASTITMRVDNQSRPVKRDCRIGRDILREC